MLHTSWLSRGRAYFAKLVAFALLGAGANVLVKGQQLELNAKVEQAKQALQAGQFDQAAAIYRELIRSAPGNSSLLLNLGLAEYMGGGSQEAIVHFRAALKLDPNLFPARMFLGASFLNLGETAKSLIHLQKAVALRPESPMARQFLGDAYLTLEDFSAARGQFARLCSLTPKSPLAWVGLGQSYDGLAQKASASLQHDAPDSYWTRLLMAEELVGQQKYADALSLYRQALHLRADLHEVHAAIAEIYRLTGHPKWEEIELQKEGTLPARDCAKQSLACSFEQGDYTRVLQQADTSKDVEAVFWVTRAYDRLASAAFAKLDELPESADRHQVMAQMYAIQNRYVDAAREWREALQMAPNNLPYEKGFAVALYENREYESAEQLLHKLLQVEPDSARWNFMLGSSLLNQHRVEEAVPYLTQAIKKNPKLPQLQQALAMAYMQSGNVQAAIPYLESALTLDTDGSLRYQLAQAYQRTGRHREADEMLRQYEQMRKEASAAQPKDAEITPP